MRPISPTSLDLFYKNRSEYYLKYLAEHRPPKIPQTQPMSIGSAFDAFVKNDLVKKIFGSDEINGGRFQLDQILEDQVEPHNMDWAREHGARLFALYQASGALADLMLELEKSHVDPRFEFTVEGRIAHDCVVEGIPVTGKPDVFYTMKQGTNVILDWKVNGYCSPRTTSPRKGYLCLRPGRTMHKDAQPMIVHGVTVNLACNLEEVDAKWADQLTIYSWLLDPGPCVYAIEQIVGPQNALRYATHRCLCSSEYQRGLLERLHNMYKIITSGWIFDTLSREDSDARCKVLDTAYAGGSEQDDWFAASHRNEGW